MKRLLSLLLTSLLLAGLCSGCARQRWANTVDDGRARPSVCEKLRVVDGKLCDKNEEPVMLRGVSLYELMGAEPFLNDELFRELSEDMGVNLIRLPVSLSGSGSVGYCAKGDKDRYKAAVGKGVELAQAHDMYVIIDWHVLSEGDPNVYLDQAVAFFAEMAETYQGCKNVLYEICNEPNGVDWPAVKTYAEAVIPVIREKDPEAVIIVGNPDWSKDLDSVAADPLAFENVMYTLHFYAATHAQTLRDMTERVSQAGLPIFVTEYSITAYSGTTPVDTDSANAWIELLEQERISYCMWSFSKIDEASSAILPNVRKYHGFEETDYSETGLWLLETLKTRKGR